MKYIVLRTCASSSRRKTIYLRSKVGVPIREGWEAQPTCNTCTDSFMIESTVSASRTSYTLFTSVMEISKNINYNFYL